MFSMKIDFINKIFFIHAEGVFSRQEGISYKKEYIEKVKQLTPYEFSFILDGAEVKASTRNVSEQLMEMMNLYMKTPFKKRILIQQKSLVARNQTQRLAREVKGFETFIFVETMSEALRLI